MPDTATIINELKADWERFKQLSDERNAATATLASQASVALIDEELERINKVIDGKSRRLEDLEINSQAKFDELHDVIAGYLRGKPAEDNSDYEKYAAQMSYLAHREISAEEVRDYGKAFVNSYIRAQKPSGEMAIGRGLRESWGPVAALQTQIDPQGGYWVPPDLSGRIVEMMHETSDVRMHAQVDATSSDLFTGQRDNETVAADWLTETQAPSEGTPNIGQWGIPVRIMGKLIQDTHFNLQDANRDVAGWIIRKLGQAFGLAEGEAMVTGNDNLRPRGITSYTTQQSAPTANQENIESVKSGHATNNLADAAKLIELTGSLKQAYQANAVWAMRRETLSEIRQLKDSVDGFIFVPDFSRSPYGAILGAPVYQWAHMPIQRTDGNKFALYGDIRAGYQVVDKPGMLMFQDPYTSQPNVKFIAYRRVGGDVVNFEAIKLLEQGA